MTSNKGMYRIRVIRTGESEVPAPEVFWMSSWGNWERLSFHMLLAYNDDTNFLVNTGLPDDLTLRNAEMRKFAGERCVFKPVDAISELERAGFSPQDIRNVSFTPIQDYTVGGLKRFPGANIFIHRQGWADDIQAPRYSKHLPRGLFIPDDILRYIEFDAWERVRFFDCTARTELIEGIEVVWVGCHHRSSLAFIISTEKGKVVFTDCAFKADNVSNLHPIGIAENIFECIDAYKALQEIGRILPAYDPSIDGLEI
ncbi:MAG: hypothetical protein KIY12_03995 [Thermoplasmata archaeon]|uniref:Metallo-beta-lactamase domain-containing protein n=1 Tax=Candidatus Sysuiplasma superficiale TaxID=2823368 RepID=A0A8J7YNB9_9ARCH|nr:hypothetical protein [Candidatus Sysuiplasma superficiale]MBX8643868.1 hypothetical protein [Candidatus Sysuiplasma superficiale]